MKYAVHLYTQVRIKVTGVEAQSPQEALKAAENSVDFHNLLQMNNPRLTGSSGLQVESIEYAEAPLEYACVDPLLSNGEVDYDMSVFLDGEGKPLVDGKTVVERKALANDLACRYMAELLDATETLSDIALVHGVRTLADLMYLHAAILEDGFIELFDSEVSKVREVVEGLPSKAEWQKYMRDTASNACSSCGAACESVIGCPSGAELCQPCFEAGQH